LTETARIATAHVSLPPPPRDLPVRSVWGMSDALLPLPVSAVRCRRDRLAYSAS